VTALPRRLLLIEPPFYRLFDEGYSLCRYPLSLAYLAAAAATGTDWKVKCYNADFAGEGRPFSVRHLSGKGHQRYMTCLADPRASIWQEAEEVLREQAPGVVGLSLKSASLASGRIVARIAKRLDPKCLVVAGGPHPTVAPDQILADGNFDLCVLGEGERTLVELLCRLAEGQDVRDVPGVAARGRRAAPRELMANLDDLPRPGDWAPVALLDHGRYPAKALGHLMATRGCPQQCTYCASHTLWSRRPRFRSPADVVAELRGFQAQGIDRVHFDDDTFGIKPAYLREVCQAMVQGCPGLGWSCETHARLISEVNLASMKRAGCHTIQLGIESGSERILKAVRKGFSIGQALEACRLIKRRGLRLEVFIMAGFPQETEESLRETMNLVRELDCDKVIFSLFTPHPGTADHKLCLSQGLLPPDYDFSQHHHQSPGNYFSPDIGPARFRELVTELEDLVQARRDQAQAGS
jgi:anaerobic magnesium-protoporphyrin IX monomethyl ester cyclase